MKGMQFGSAVAYVCTYIFAGNALKQELPLLDNSLSSLVKVPEDEHATGTAACMIMQAPAAQAPDAVAYGALP